MEKIDWRIEGTIYKKVRGHTAVHIKKPDGAEAILFDYTVDFKKMTDDDKVFDYNRMYKTARKARKKDDIEIIYLIGFGNIK